MAVKVLKDDLPLLERALLALSREEVLVGIFEDGGKHAGSGLSNAEVGYLMEYGDDALRIPERPTLGPGMDRAKSEMVAELRAGMVSALKDAASLKLAGSAMHDALKAAGEAGEASVKREMRAGQVAPLAPATIEARRRRGNGSTRPLIDTAELYGSVTSKVRKKGASE